ncbi:hypothetical protein [Streptomyces sp. NPDC001744]|uniref:hypothetical protein n=1 Tax=Streptomyces sp. NPDC001744 TaxID=3364606 RepID=UPI0036A6F0F2
MSDLTSALIVNASVLATTLGFDLGRRAFDGKRVRRPVIICGIVAVIFVKTLFTSGVGLIAEMIGVALGVLIGLLAVSRMKVTKQVDDTIHTVAGTGYAMVWVGMAVLRSVFSIGLTYWFGTSMGTWLVRQGASPSDVTAIITNFLVFMAVTAMITRTLAIRARAAALPAPSAAVR